jgi:hypothetical protein
VKNTFLFLLLTLTSFAQNKDSIVLKNIYNFYLTKSTCYKNLETLTSKIGGRLSGSPQAEQAVYWAKKAMYAAGADTVILQPCMVPHWVRGEKEKCILYFGKANKSLALKVTALGSSVSTGKTGFTAPVIEVKSFEELEQLGEKNIKGKIVFYNVFFDQTHISTGDGYRGAVPYRGQGASKAAKYGALASVVRSMSSVADDEPHTGNMWYDSTVSKIKIPAFALSFKAADQLSAQLKIDKSAKLYLESSCQTLQDVPSFNVIGEIFGTEKSNDYIIAGGHLDSWDLGQGAHDNGTGVVQSIEMLAMFKTLGFRPKHNIRAVAFMNEENGLAGGKAYAKFAVENNEKHLVALETDAGGFTPRGFGIDTTMGLYNLVVQWKKLFAPYLIDRFNIGGGGADLSSLKNTGVPCIGFEPDGQRYFDIHHTAQDSFDKVNKRELELSAAAIGAIIYLLDLYK